MKEQLTTSLNDLFGLNEQVLSESVLVYRCGYDIPPSSHVEIVEQKINSPLPYKDFQFSYALSRYPFFKEENDSQSILTQLKELIRVAKEVRLAPYLLESQQVAKKFGPVILALQQESIGVEITPLTLPEFKHAVRVKLWAHECKLS